jgi:broad specificity phosphatase PhoE
MKIFILRHENRTIDATMFSPLTLEGLNNSNNLIKCLEDLNINVIYSSPFIRTMQTIYPYSKKNNVKLKLDYSLVELLNEEIIPPKSFNVELPKYIAESFNYDSEYVPIMTQSDLIYPERYSILQSRVKQFLKNIIIKHNKKEDNILIVTHQGVCNVILKIIENYSEIPNEIIENYPTGLITQVFNINNWLYKKIN